MSELKKCSRCRSEIQLQYFAINRKGEYNKTCETCLNKTRKTKSVITTIDDTTPLEKTDVDFVDEMDEVTTTGDSETSTPEEQNIQHSVWTFVLQLCAPAGVPKAKKTLTNHCWQTILKLLVPQATTREKSNILIKTKTQINVMGKRHFI